MTSQRVTRTRVKWRRNHHTTYLDTHRSHTHSYIPLYPAYDTNFTATIVSLTAFAPSVANDAAMGILLEAGPGAKRSRVS